MPPRYDLDFERLKQILSPSEVSVLLAIASPRWNMREALFSKADWLWQHPHWDRRTLPKDVPDLPRRRTTLSGDVWFMAQRLNEWAEEWWQGGPPTTKFRKRLIEDADLVMTYNVEDVKMMELESVKTQLARAIHGREGVKDCSSYKELKTLVGDAINRTKWILTHFEGR